MSKRTSYEWDIETWDEDDDIVDHDFYETAKEMLDALTDWGQPANPKERYKPVLVRSFYTDSEGLVDRWWAYIEDGKLPEVFSTDTADGFKQTDLKVSKRLQAEWRRATKS